MSGLPSACSSLQLRTQITASKMAMTTMLNGLACAFRHSYRLSPRLGATVTALARRVGWTFGFV